MTVAFYLPEKALKRKKERTFKNTDTEREL